MDSVALAVLLTELFISIQHIGGYRVPEVYPDVHQLSAAELQQRFCNRPCSLKAFYIAHEGVFIDDSLDLNHDVYARSILLHELDHVQAQSSRFDATKNPCVRSNRAEAEAYRLQNDYLASIQSLHRVAMSGWAARCRSNEVPTPGLG